MFNRLDTTDDRRIDVTEFKKGLEFVAKWGVKIAEDQVDTEFGKIDTNGGGFILFDEFSTWAISKALDLEEDDDAGAPSMAELQGLETTGYVAAKGGFAKSRGLVQKEPLPRMCYTYMGIEVAVQTMAKAEPARSPNRRQRTTEFRPEARGGLPVVGGVPMRRLVPGSKFLNSPSRAEEVS